MGICKGNQSLTQRQLKDSRERAIKIMNLMKKGVCPSRRAMKEEIP